MKDKLHKGVTLLELTIAMGMWLALSIGIFLLWQYVTNTTANMLMRQNALENSRAAMDGLVMNIQLASHIRLETDSNNVLERLTLTERNPQGQLHNYVFDFNINAAQGTPRHQVLRLGENEFVSNIAAIYMEYVYGRRINIAVVSACYEPLRLYGSVNVRYKNVVVG